MLIQIIFHSRFGHVYHLAEAIKKGAEHVEGVQVHLSRVEETISDEELKASGAKKAQDSFKHIPFVQIENLQKADALVIGSPARFGSMSTPMSTFFDSTEAQWKAGALVGKIGSAFTSSSTQHGGQETTLRTLQTAMLHHGMLLAGVPHTFEALKESEEVSGGSPYGATTISGADYTRTPSRNELAIARFQGRHIAELVKKQHHA